MSREIDEDDDRYAMPAEEFRDAQDLLTDLIKTYEIPLISMIMLFSNQLAFATKHRHKKDILSVGLAVAETFGHFSNYHTSKNSCDYMKLVDEIYETLTNEDVHGLDQI